MFFFCTSLISFCYFFTLLYFYILCKHILNHTKFPQLNVTHSSVYIGMRFHLYIFFTMFYVSSFFLLYLFGLQLSFFNTFQKVINSVG